MSRIQLAGLTKRFGTPRASTTAVDGIDLVVADGEFLVLLGPSGCGKSTLLRMIAGLVPPTAGHVVIDDRDVTAVPPRDRDLAMVFQSYALYPHLTVAANIGFPLRVRGWRREAVRTRVAAVAEELQLTDLLRRRPKQLSGGQRQRVALGRALVREPGAFLMDEPLSNLDATLRTSTRAGISALHRRLGATIVYVTHDQVEAMTMATRVALLDGGRIEQVGTPSEVYDTPATAFVAGFLGSPPMNLVPVDARVDDGGVTATAEGLDARIGVPGPGGSPRPVVLGVRPEHLHVGAGRAVSLDAVVDVVENLGSEEIARCRLGLAGDGAAVAVRGPRPLGLAGGDRIALSAAEEHVHLFDPESGRRLVRHPAIDPDHTPVETPDRPLARSSP